MRLLRPNLAVTLITAFGAILAPVAGASRPVLHQLPPATHAGVPAVSSDGAVWFNLYYGSAHYGSSYGSAQESAAGSYVGRLGPEGTLAEVPVPDGYRTGKPVAVPGGDVWFPEFGEAGVMIARFSLSGQVQSYPLEGVTGIRSLTAMNGSIWFAGSGTVDGKAGGVVGSIAVSTDGSVHLFPLEGYCTANPIAAAKGAVWFGEKCGSGPGLGPTISRLYPSGRIVRNRLGVRGFVSSAAVGPGGTVWFGLNREYGKQGVVRIDRAGRFAVYQVANASFYESMAVGPGGRLWFSSTFGGDIDRGLNWIDTRGAVGKPICVDSNCSQEAQGLGTGPDGSLWFSTATPHTIGGGGFTQIIEGETIANEAGFVGQLAP